MLDLRLIRDNPEMVKTALLKRMDDVSFDELLKWDKNKRNLMTETENMKAHQNRISKTIPIRKKNGEDVSDSFMELKQFSNVIKENDTIINELGAKIQDFLDILPNIPADDVVAGDKENNQVVRTWGKKREFAWEPKNHVDLAVDLGLIDYERGVKMGGNGFWLYTGMGAQLEWALLNYFIEEHTKDGYTFIMPPHILNYQSGYTAGQFPKFEDDVFRVDADPGTKIDKFLLPTSETALINMYRDEILTEDELPKKLFSFTPCYRREAGSYRANERGMIRGHQFNKVEMFQYTIPENSDAALEELINKAEKLVQGLGLHYQLSKLAAKDVSASMAKTYDIEVWINSMNEYKEVSSASNAKDYQARRGNIRFKRNINNTSKNARKNEYLHTLNASGLATSRIIPAILEQHQREDGGVNVPEVLVKWLGTEVIKSS